MWKMSIQYPSPGFELKTFSLRATTFTHWTRAAALRSQELNYTSFNWNRTQADNETKVGQTGLRYAYKDLC